MQITTKAKVSIALMADLAIKSVQGPVSLASMAWRLGVSLSYLEILCRPLRTKGLVTATRGPGGGYQLGKSPRDIRVMDILEAVETPSKMLTDAGIRPGAGEEDEVTLALYRRAEQEVVNYLSSVSLADLLPAHDAQKSGRNEPSWLPSENVGRQAFPHLFLFDAASTPVDVEDLPSDPARSRQEEKLCE